MDTARPTANSSTPSVYSSTVIACHPSRSRVGPQPARLLAGPRVGGEHVVHGQLPTVQAYVVTPQHLLDRGHDVGEPQLPGQERLHADLVGGVVDRGRGAAASAGLSGQAYGGERLVVEREELPRLFPAP